MLLLCCTKSASSQCRSEHFPEFFQAAQGATNKTAQATKPDANAQQQQSMPSEAQKAADAHHTDPLSALQGNPDPVMSSNLTQPTANSSADVDATTTGAAPPDIAQQPLRNAVSSEPMQASMAGRQEDDDRQHAQPQASSSGQDDLEVRFADVGCGFGGLLVRLSPLYPNTLMVGMEIRDKVCMQLHASMSCALPLSGECTAIGWWAANKS